VLPLRSNSDGFVFTNLFLSVCLLAKSYEQILVILERVKWAFWWFLLSGHYDVHVRSFLDCLHRSKASHYITVTQLLFLSLQGRIIRWWCTVAQRCFPINVYGCLLLFLTKLLLPPWPRSPRILLLLLLLCAVGLRACSWPGRSQIIKGPGVTYYLDGAHTSDSMQVSSQVIYRCYNSVFLCLFLHVCFVLLPPRWNKVFSSWQDGVFLAAIFQQEMIPWWGFI